MAAPLNPTERYASVDSFGNPIQQSASAGSYPCSETSQRPPAPQSYRSDYDSQAPPSDRAYEVVQEPYPRDASQSFSGSVRSYYSEDAPQRDVGPPHSTHSTPPSQGAQSGRSPVFVDSDYEREPEADLPSGDAGAAVRADQQPQSRPASVASSRPDPVREQTQAAVVPYDDTGSVKSYSSRSHVSPPSRARDDPVSPTASATPRTQASATGTQSYRSFSPPPRDVASLRSAQSSAPASQLSDDRRTAPDSLQAQPRVADAALARAADARTIDTLRKGLRDVVHRVEQRSQTQMQQFAQLHKSLAEVSHAVCVPPPNTYLPTQIPACCRRCLLGPPVHPLPW